MQFSEVIGQQDVKQRLLQTVGSNRVSHAQLFLGPEGSGNLALAIAYAQYISCESRSEEDSCGSCPSCIKYNNLAHPDLHFIFPVATTKEIAKEPTSAKFMKSWRETVTENPYISLGEWHRAIGVENKQAIINALDCNEIIKKLSLKSFESEFKVMIIWRPERLFHSAAPKLLKILEEPPDKTLFVLVAENQGQIIKTILSRTQIIKVNKIEPKDIGIALSERFQISGKELDNIVRYSSGNYTEALRLIQNSENKEFNAEEFKNWMRLCFTKDVVNIMQWVEKIAKIGSFFRPGFFYNPV